MWIEAVLKPMISTAVREGLNLDVIGSALVGFGVSCCKNAGMTPDQIRTQIVEPALTGVPPPR